MVQLDAPAIGFRVFSWDGVQLGASGVAYPWPVTKAPQVASCVIGEQHKAPQEHCSCGIYAKAAAPAGWVGVGGVILGYGNLVIHPDGFRAEKAEIVALVGAYQGIARHRVPEHLQVTAEAYGARLVSGWDEALLLAKEQGGAEVPEALYQQAEVNATRPGWFKNTGGWEYHDHITLDKEPQPVNFAGLPQFFVDFVQKRLEFTNLLNEKRAEAKALLTQGAFAGEITIIINLAT